MGYLTTADTIGIRCLKCKTVALRIWDINLGHGVLSLCTNCYLAATASYRLGTPLECLESLDQIYATYLLEQLE